jgi:hypothetical protein
MGLEEPEWPARCCQPSWPAVPSGVTSLAFAVSCLAFSFFCPLWPDQDPTWGHNQLGELRPSSLGQGHLLPVAPKPSP